ncbi:MAG TPA: PPK2 family polyphosphate kinase [Opitutales bacterium]|jgi:PPK2 family polyphosphate:nucleotide phosphotransferase|nr:PPK2 family polyphosphate kinase [Opitutales bacterium]
MSFDPADLRVAHGAHEPLRQQRPDSGLGFGSKSDAVEMLAELLPELRSLHDRLNAQRTWSFLVILQAMDAAGKDGIVKHVLTGFNQQSCHVTSFSAPVGEELSHSFLWRCMAALPPRGHIGVFNRSYYEEVLVPRVRPEYIGYQRLPAPCLNGDITDVKHGRKGFDEFRAKLKMSNAKPAEKPSSAFWRGRLDDINTFERHLARNGTRVVKFFLHLSRDEQKKRFLTRIDDTARNWKFTPSDVRDRRYWEQYHHAYSEIFTTTSTPWAPWYIIPADYKYVARLAVAKILIDELSTLHPRYPQLDKHGRKALAKAKRELLHED